MAVLISDTYCFAVSAVRLTFFTPKCLITQIKLLEGSGGAFLAREKGVCSALSGFIFGKTFSGGLILIR